jgi:hypothetical protein
MTTHIAVPKKQGDGLDFSCFKCSFKVLMSWTPEYAAVVVDIGDRDIRHLAQGQVFEYGKSEGYSMVPFEERGEVPNIETSQLPLTFQSRGSSSSGHG